MLAVKYCTRSTLATNPKMCYNEKDADVAQLVEQLIRNEQVTGSIPAIGSIFYYNHSIYAIIYVTIIRSFYGKTKSGSYQAPYRTRGWRD